MAPSLSQQPPSQNWDPVKSPLFEKLVGGSTPSRKEGREGVHTMNCHPTAPLNIWVKVFKNAPNKTCRRQPFKILLDPFLNTVTIYWSYTLVGSCQFWSWMLTLLISLEFGPRDHKPLIRALGISRLTKMMTPCVVSYPRCRFPRCEELFS